MGSRQCLGVAQPTRGRSGILVPGLAAFKNARGSIDVGRSWQNNGKCRSGLAEIDLVLADIETFDHHVAKFDRCWSMSDNGWSGWTKSGHVRPMLVSCFQLLVDLGQHEANFGGPTRPILAEFAACCNFGVLVKLGGVGGGYVPPKGLRLGLSWAGAACGGAGLRMRCIGVCHSHARAGLMGRDVGEDTKVPLQQP